MSDLDPNPDLDRDVRVEAIEHLQEAINALVEEDYGGYSERVGAATRVLNEAADVPYHLQDAGGPPVEAYGPSVSLPGGHSAWVTLPGHIQDPEHDFAININDHLHLYVRGERKHDPTFIVASDEFDSTLEISDDWGNFTVDPNVALDGQED